MHDHGVQQLQHTLPEGIWLSFDFDDSHPVPYRTLKAYCVFFVATIDKFIIFYFLILNQDLPALYLQGGSIIPFSHPCQHVGEADPSDDLSIIIALDENGTSFAFDFCLSDTVKKL